MHFMNILTELLHKVGSLVNLKCEHVTCRLNLGILSFIWTVFGTFGTCKIEVKNEDESGQCDLCNKWNHAFYVDISFAEYEQLKLSNLQWYCLVCAKEMPFSSLSNKEFNIFLSRNPPHTSAQALPSKKFDKHTK